MILVHIVFHLTVVVVVVGSFVEIENERVDRDSLVYQQHGRVISGPDQEAVPVRRDATWNFWKLKPPRAGR